MLNNKLFMLLALAVLGAAIGGYYYINQPVSSAPSQEEVNKESSPVQESLSESEVKAALKDRILGDINAPIKISEHSSLTCGHCGKFHQTSFKVVKEQLIDTGKAYLVFSDFPLNAPALHASTIARCVPHDKYFDFVQMLFEQQSSWAYERNYIQFLEKAANDYGLSTPDLRRCLSSEALQGGILERMRAAQTQWQVNSTPSFVVNNKTLIGGAVPAEKFIEQVLEAAQGQGASE